MDRYFITLGNEPEKEISQAEFIRWESQAGFRPKPGCGPVATGGFTSGMIKGRVEHGA